MFSSEKVGENIDSFVDKQQLGTFIIFRMILVLCFKVCIFAYRNNIEIVYELLYNHWLF